jgi:ribokinase
MKYDVVTFGSAILDVFIESPDIWLKDDKSVKRGKIIAIPYGEKCEVEKMVIGSGGGGTNTAVGFSRLGLKSVVVARCGWDFAGKIIRAELKKEKVADEFLAQVEKEETDYSTVLLAPDGERTIFIYRGKTRLDSSVIDFGKLNSWWFYCSSLEGNLDLLKKIVSQAKNINAKIAVNPGRRELKMRDRLLAIAQSADVFILNREEIMELAMENDGDVAFKIIAGKLPNSMVIMTDGDNGASINVPGKGVFSVGGFKVEMVDATGPGDAFGAGFIGGMIRGLSLEDSLRLGICNGASVVEKIGAKPGLLTWSQGQNWLAKCPDGVWRKL